MPNNYPHRNASNLTTANRSLSWAFIKLMIAIGYGMSGGYAATANEPNTERNFSEKLRKIERDFFNFPLLKYLHFKEQSKKTIFMGYLLTAERLYNNNKNNPEELVNAALTYQSAISILIFC